MVGEESDVVRSILESGHSGYWIPEATVSHIISPERQTTQYVVQRYKSQGATELYLLRRNRRPHEPLWFLAAKVAITYSKYVVSRAFDLQPFWVKNLKFYAFWLGALQERLRNR
jgi:hypothetical protein